MSQLPTGLSEALGKNEVLICLSTPLKQSQSQNNNLIEAIRGYIVAENMGGLLINVIQMVDVKGVTIESLLSRVFIPFHKIDHIE